MFVSDDDLKLTYGVDLQIGKCLVDRKVPVDNLYWKSRYLYIPPMTGYLFIPIYIDLQYRLGIPKEELLSEPHLLFLEAVLHSAAKQEFLQITKEEHIRECIALGKQYGKNHEYLELLANYFSGRKDKVDCWPGSEIQALNRGDAYLFTFSFFDLDIDELRKHMSTWRAFIDYYLILDDFDDLEPDYDKGDENSLLEVGVDRAAPIMKTVLYKSYEVLESVNPVLANRIDWDIHKRKIDAAINAFLKKKGL
ncbi:MAG: hypothetical protein KIT80_01770 [Chitinophagaceae bacterium]|nr:hypothetical protein [Chitinophagaceae bacterium]MCW5925613.1 hypothetical protein [Chitinophagaceae bacterium]